MKAIHLLNRYKDDVKLLYVRKEGDFYVFKHDESFVWNYCQIMLDKDGNQIGIDPEGGPYMMNGYKIKGMVLDHFDKEGNFYFKKKISYKVCAMSDLHGYLPSDIEECDIVCICGDIMPLEIQRDYTGSFKWFTDTFFPWVNDLPCEKVFFIGGNHDFLLEQISTKAMNRIARENCYEKLVYLNNTEFEYDGIHIYGCPQVESLESWAFYSDDCHEYTNIPYCTDILLTHMPPKIEGLGYIPKYGDLGSVHLRTIGENRNIKLWFCGHMHDGNHEIVEHNGCKIKNVSIKNDDYQVVNPITYINYETK